MIYTDLIFSCWHIFKFFGEKPDFCGSPGSLLSLHQDISPKKSESSGLLQSFRHFPYNENPTRALKTTSLIYCLPSTDAIDRQEQINVCV